MTLILKLSITISEKGNPPLKRLQEIADTLNVPLTDLFDQPQENTIHCPYCGAKLKIEKE